MDLMMISLREMLAVEVEVLGFALRRECLARLFGKVCFV